MTRLNLHCHWHLSNAGCIHSACCGRAPPPAILVCKVLFSGKSEVTKKMTPYEVYRIFYVGIRLCAQKKTLVVTQRTTTIPLLACFPLSDALTLATSSLNKLLAKCVNLVKSDSSSEASTGSIVILLGDYSFERSCE